MEGFNMNREEVLEKIKKRNIIDEIDVFMLGLEAPLEREIMRYIYFNNNVVNFQMLIIKFVYKGGLCTKTTLERRLESLVKFKFLLRSDYKGTIFYEVQKESEPKVNA